MYYLKDTIVASTIDELNNKIKNSGTLVLSDNQEVLDYCGAENIPAAAMEHDDITGLKCDYILTDYEEVEDDDLEGIYRRCLDIPWDIADTNRCHIRELSMDDIDVLFEIYAKPGVTDYMEPLFEYQKEVAYERNYIDFIYKLYGFGMWLVFDKFTGELIGRAGIEVRETCQEENQAELGFMISPDRWRQGLAYEVCLKIIELGFEKYGLTSLVSRCDPKNTASKALLGKLGFTFVEFREDGDCFYLLRQKNV